jgi:hypothetical protein
MNEFTAHSYSYPRHMQWQGLRVYPVQSRQHICTVASGQCAVVRVPPLLPVVSPPLVAVRVADAGVGRAVVALLADVARAVSTVVLAAIAAPGL